jgi:hypothetical protein
MSKSLHRTPGRLQVREGGGCLSVFGTPFFAAGIFMILGSLRVIPIQNADDVGVLGLPVLLLMGVVFTLVGGTLVFGRSWTTVDTMQRTVMKQWGLLVPMGGKTYRLDDYVLVCLEFKRGDSDSADQFPVSLKARTGPDLPLFRSTQYAESRERAAAVAELLHVDIVDMTTDHAVRMAAGQVDVPLQHRLRVDHEPAEKVARPAALKSEITEQNGETRIAIPMRRYHPAFFLVFLIPMAMAASFVAPFDQFFRATRTPHPFAWIFLGFFIFGFVGMPLLAAANAFLKARRGRTIVTVSPAGIRLDERRVWKTRNIASIPASDIVGIDYSTTDSALLVARQGIEQQHIGKGTERAIAVLSTFVKGGGVTIKTRQGLRTFGDGLDDEEIKYVHFVVRQAIAAIP